MAVDVVITGHVRGKPHEIESIENLRGMRGGGEKVKRTYRIFEIDEVEAIEGASSAELENKRVIVYPSQGVRSCPSVYEQMLLLEAGTGDSGLSNYLELFGTYAKADNNSLPFAGAINVWKVNSLEEEGAQYREGKKKEMMELLKKE